MPGGKETKNQVPVWLENAVESWNRYRAKQRFLADPNDVDAGFAFLKTTLWSDRYMPQELPVWKLWVDGFIVNYKLQNEETRQKIRERIKQELPARNHALLVEMLWEFSEGTDRNRWLHTLLQELWHYNSQDEDRRKEFLFSVVHLEGIPKEVREPIRMENSVMENSVIAMQERALV
ncbi:MAG: hypothetical protein AAB457_03970 [Patescibacteria group bacterium]